ncbi:hypothetical protein SAMN05444396_1202 [Flavobacterium segetis]|uniref:Uncharacterized protein n=1 Tax=Flavobacterium segetis TaxID=271157 RepID=A0A1M5K5F9_9FLAO|nr:hypothetical protein [Flavobacterium segetis]SHG47473.1 hypothetical protein SAMN05444396_1202 [Flavobacterium segetis]
MNAIETEKHTKYSLELIFNEADKMSTDLLGSISENVNKSFILLAIYFSVLSFSFFKIIENYNFLYSILIIGTLLGCYVLRKNIFPNTICLKGALPEIMLQDYFSSFTEEDLDKEYLATQIESYNYAMIENKKTIEKMVIRFKKSIYIVLFSFFLFGFISALFLFTECL